MSYSDNKVCRLWEDKFVDRNAPSIKRALYGCRYIIEADWRKVIIKEYAPNGKLWDWGLSPGFREQFIYPNCKLKDHVFVVEMRGMYADDEIFLRNELGLDAIYLGTNNERLATILKLQYS